MSEQNHLLGNRIKAIGKVKSPFKEKFGVPRQAGLAGRITSQLLFNTEEIAAAAFDGIMQHSHIWVLFLFHQNQGWKPKVRPPRLGGNAKVGVFATRSSFRPNGIGMSAVRLIASETIGNQHQLTVQGLDVVDGTPIIDIKPYIPYADSIAGASSEMAGEAPNQLDIRFSDQALTDCQALASSYPNLMEELKEILSLDPRPAYKARQEDNKRYAMAYQGLDVYWCHHANGIEVVSLCLKDKFGG